MAAVSVSERVVAYLRVSTSEQADHGFGLDVQRERIADYCRREGLDLAAEFADPGVSGTTSLAERDGLTAALEAVHAGNGSLRGLVVARPDRLARDTLQALVIEREFDRAGVPVRFAEGPNGSDDPHSKMLRTFLHAIAEADRAITVSRLAAARKRKAARGGYAGGRPPFGYEARRGQLHVVPEEVETIRWIFERVARDRWPIRRVVAALNEAGSNDRRWHPSAVERILGREDYKRGSNDLWPKGSKLVDARIWNKAQAVLAERRRG